MDFSIKEHAHERYIHVRFFGQVNDEILIKFLDKSFLTPAFGSKDQLVDYSEVTRFRFTAPGAFKYCEKLNDRCKAWPLQKKKESRRCSAGKYYPACRVDGPCIHSRVAGSRIWSRA